MVSESKEPPYLPVPIVSDGLLPRADRSEVGDDTTVQTKAQTDCLYALQAEKTGFVPMDTKPLCGLPYGS